MRISDWSSDVCSSDLRLYGEKDVRRLRFIMRARALGFTIEEIRGLLTLVDGGTQTCVEVKARTELHLADVRAKIADLRRRSEEHTSELQSLMRISYAVLCLKKKKQN